MKKYRGLVLFLFLLILDCNDDRFFDPTLFHSEFKGITYTNIEYLQEHGVNDSMIVDPDDWKFDSEWLYYDVGNSNAFSYDSNYILNLSSYEVSQDTAIVMPPWDWVHSMVCPAYPNPINRNGGIVYIRFVVPGEYGYFYMAIIDKDYNVVKTLVDPDGLMISGYYLTTWDLTNDQGKKVYSDVYRCIVRLRIPVGSYQSHGDIWVMNSE